MSTPGLSRLLRPRHVAVIGSTSRHTGIGARTLRHLRDGGFDGEITVASAGTELPAGVDVAIVAVPAAAAPAVVADVSGRAAYVLVYSSGFEEVGGEPLRTTPGSGSRLIGPNSVGLYYRPSRTTLTFAAAFDHVLAPTGAERSSGIFLVSQSGAFGARLVQYAQHYGVAVDGFLGSGNETDYGACELAADLVADPAFRPRVIALYLENVRDGAVLRRLLVRAAAERVSVVVLLGGASESGAKAARSHTAAVSPEHTVVSELCARYGGVLVGSDRELAEAMLGLSLLGRADGPRLAVVTGSGGAGVVAADLLGARGVTVPPLSSALQQRLTARLPGYAAVTNPVDVTAQVIGDTDALAAVCADIAGSGEADALLVIGRAEQVEAVRAAAGHLPALVCALDADPAAVAPAIRAGLPVMPGLEAACNVARAVSTPWGPGPDDGDTALPTTRDGHRPSLPGTAEPDTVSCLRLVSEAGVPVAPWRLVRGVAAAAQAGAALGWPVVLKANLPARTHKALHGGVRLDVGPDEVEAAAKELLKLAPELIVARQLRGGPELMVGVRHDPVCGLTVVAGLGGGHVELVGRTVSVPADAPPGWLRRRLAAEIFDRGGPRYAALPALLTEVAATLSGLAGATGLALIECNPLISVGDRLVALDARVITHD